MFFHGGSLNRGCEAIVRSGVALLKSRYPDAVIDLASGNPESDKVIPLINQILHDKPSTIKRFTPEWLVNLAKVRLFNDETYAHRYINQSIISLIPKYDIFLSIGGDNYCYGEQPGVYEIDRCIKKADKTLILWGASIGEEDLSSAKIDDLKLFDAILVRETITRDILEKNGLTNVKLVADGAFLMDKEELPLPEGWAAGNTVGLNFSPLVYKKNPEAKKAFSELIDHILNTTDMAIALTPHVTEAGNSDYEILKEFSEKHKQTGRVLLLPDNLNAIQYKGYIARMRFFVGARTHATIAAYSNAVPTMVLGYSVKSKGIAKDLFGEEKLVLSLAEISDSKKLIAKFDEMLAEENAIRERLSQALPHIKSMSAKAADYLLEAAR
jgi:polysaccharide pyruvyl transferase WcaK-like protein